MSNRTMPAQKPGLSEQDVVTDPEFIAAVKERFGDLDVDLAATPANAQAPLYISPEQDSLSVPWARTYPRKILWLNPPFGRIAPWAEKCAEEGAKILRGRGKILLLTPASVGSNWFAHHLFGHAFILALRPRLTFVGHAAGYPKDLILSVFNEKPGFDVWKWR